MRRDPWVRHRRSEPSPALLRVTWVDARNSDLDTYFAAARLRIDHLAYVEDVCRFALTFIPRCKHCVALPPSRIRTARSGTFGFMSPLRISVRKFTIGERISQMLP